jgi:BASS family bile acid:Na+ symporter
MNLQKLILVVLQVSVLLSVFAIGLKASFQEATYLFRRPGELVRALLAMNVLMPVFAVVLISVFEFHPVIRIALVALSLSPIPPLLPSKLVKEGGTNAYAIGLLVAISLLAIFIAPLAIEVIELVRKVPLQMTPASVAKVIFITALLPIGFGIAVHALVPTLAQRIAKPIALISIIALLVCMVAMWIAAGPSMWALMGNGTVIALAAFVLAGLAIGHLLGGPRPENRTSLALATASRHPGIALAIAAANFPEEKLAGAALLLYLLVNAVVSIPYLLWIKRRRTEVENQLEESST